MQFLVLLGDRLVWVFGPGDPDFLGLQLVEGRAGVANAGDVIPVFVGGNERMHLLVRFHEDVLGDLADMCFFVWRADEDTAVDENVARGVS
jgi:hypothetical protein